MTIIPTLRQILAGMWFWLLLLMLIANALRAEDPPVPSAILSAPAISDQDRIQLLLTQRSALLAEIRRLQALIQLHEASAAAKPSTDAMDSLYKQLSGKAGCKLDAEFRCPPPPTASPSPGSAKSLDTPRPLKP